MHFQKQHAPTVVAAENQSQDSLPDASAVGLETILQFQPVATVRPRIWDGVFIAELTGVNAEGRALLSLPEMPIMAPAISTVAIEPVDVGRQAAVMFQQGDVRRPMLIGWIQGASPRQPSRAVQANLDDDRLELSANREIVLRCGRASITLTRAGKILIRGAYVSSRSSGANCIRGGSVQIN